MATEDVSIRVRLDDLEKELAKIPGITEKQMKAMLSAVNKGYREQTRAAERAASDQARAAERAAKEAEQAAAKMAREYEARYNDIRAGASTVFGGVVNDLDDVAKALGALGPAGGALVVGFGAVAASVAAIPLAAATAVTAIVGIQRAAEEALQSLNDLGMSELISAEQRARVEESAAALDAFGGIVDALIVTIAADFGPTIMDAALTLGNFALTVLDAVDSVSQGQDILERFAQVLAGTVVGTLTGGLLQIASAASVVELALGATDGPATTAVRKFGELRDSALEAVTGIDGLDESTTELGTTSSRMSALIEEQISRRAAERQEQEKQIQSTKNEAEARRAAAAQAREQAAAERTAAEAQREAEQAARAVAAAIEQLTGFSRDYQRSQLDAEGQIAAAYQDRVNRIGELERAALAQAASEAEAAAIVAAADGARIAAKDELLGKLAELDEAVATGAEGQIAAAEAVSETWIEEWTRVSGTVAQVLDQIRAQYEPLIDAVAQIGQAWMELHRTRLDAIMDERERQLEAIQSLRGEERRAAVERLKELTKEANERRKKIADGFRANQAAQIASAIIDGARAALSLIPAFAFLGPAAPAAAVAVAGTATAIQVAAIAAQKPKFHTGLDPSEMPAILTRGEGVANQTAMASPGFREQLRAANAGMAPAAPAPVVIALNDRILAQLDARTSTLTGRDRRGTIRLVAGTATHYGG